MDLVHRRIITMLQTHKSKNRQQITACRYVHLQNHKRGERRGGRRQRWGGAGRLVEDREGQRQTERERRTETDKDRDTDMDRYTDTDRRRQTQTQAVRIRPTQTDK